MRTCPFCGTENEPFFRFCLGCGADLDEALGAADEPPPKAAERVASEAAGSIPAPSPTDTVTDLAPVVVPREEAAGEARQVAPAASAPMVAPRVTPSTRPVGPSPSAAAPAPVATPVPPGAQGAAKPALPAVDRPVAGPPPISKVAAPRVADARVKTMDPGSLAKVGASASVQAVAQAQVDAAERRAAPPGTGTKDGRPEVAARGTALGAAPPPVEGPTKKTQGSPAVPAPVAKRPPSADPKAPARAQLVIILEDGTDGARLDLVGDSTVIGRDGADINFQHDDFLAPRHAELFFKNGGLYLRPLKSTNGVFLQVHQEVELESGDVFRIGQQLLVFESLALVAGEPPVETKDHTMRLGSPIPEGAWGRLGQLIAPDTMGSVYLLGGTEVYLGRERGDITFPGDGFVSGLHSVIAQRGGHFFLKDLGSSNGTYLRLTKAMPVRRGMLVLAGQQLFRVEQ